MLFSLSFTKQAVKQFILYPKALLKLPYGVAKANIFLEQSRRRKWLNNPKNNKRVDNFTMFLHPNETEGISTHIGADSIYEPAETSLLLEVLRGGMTFVDIGANIGWYTLHASLRVGANGKVVAFEPESRNYALLEASVKFNGFKNVLLSCMGVSNQRGKCKLYSHTTNFGNNTILKPSDVYPFEICNEYPTSEIETVQLDKALLTMGIGHVDVIKIDIEGAEALAVDGAQQIFHDAKHVFMEWNKSAWVNKAELFKSVFNGFEVFEIVDSPFLVKRTTFEDLLNKDISNIYLRRKLNRVMYYEKC